MEVNEGEVSEVVGMVNLEPEACTEGQDKDESVTVGVKFLEKVYPFLLADLFVVSGWVKRVECCGIGESNQKWSCDNCLRFCWSEGEAAPC